MYLTCAMQEVFMSGLALLVGPLSIQQQMESAIASCIIPGPFAPR